MVIRYTVIVGCQLVPRLADVIILEINNAPQIFIFDMCEDFDGLMKKGLIPFLMIR